MDTIDINYKGILNYLENNQEVPYSDPNAGGISKDEKERLLKVKTNGQIVVAEMKKIAEQCKQLYELNESLRIDWLDGSNTKTKKYLWLQMKYKKYKDSPISVSLFVQKNNGNALFRVSLEIKNAGVDKKEIARYHSHLDIPIEDGMVYVSGSNQWGNPDIITDSVRKIKEKLDSGLIRKVQPSILIESSEGKTNEEYNSEIMSAIGKIIKYYDYVIGNSNPRNLYWPSIKEYDPGITKDKWLELLNDESVTHLENIKMFKMMLYLGGESTCANLAEKCGKSASYYNRLGSAFGKRVHDKIGCRLCKDGSTERYFTIPFVGRYIIENHNKRYSWKLREELREALEEMNLSNIDITTENVSEISYDKNMILYGPPGTGKTYSSAIYAVAICDKLDINSVKAMDYDDVMSRYKELLNSNRVAFITFHQSYSYEEFIEGIKPVLDDKGGIGYTIEDGIFKKFCKSASLSETNEKELNESVYDENLSLNNNYVFIIDEINRGNISKIFGELITLIEDTKREGMDEQASAMLPYSSDIFSVPSNIYILGTMNTADRSIALMDTALRRRFQFIEMMPDADVLRKIGADKVEDLNVAMMLEKINERIAFLYDREHTIGHAFFTKLAKSPTIETLESIFEKSVIPLLQEYFYEDYQKIQFVLGDSGKSDSSIKFIIDEKVNIKDVFKGNVEDVIDFPEKKYVINKAAFKNIESYKQII